MVKYAPRKVYIRESGGYVELSYTEFCRCRESDQTYMDNPDSGRRRQAGELVWDYLRGTVR